MRFTILIPALFLIQSMLYSQTIVINEFMAANNESFADEDGDFPDWIELYNDGINAFDLSGWYLSDSRANLRRWKLPAVFLATKSHLLIFASGKDRKPEFSRTAAPYWETIIREGDLWRYLVPQTQPSAFWAHLRYDDSQWAEGASGFGYGDSDDATVIANKMSIYVRHSFQIENVEDVVHAFMHVDYDDAFVAYLNGVEVARRNIGAPGEVVTFDQKAETQSEAYMVRGLAPPLVANDLKKFLQTGGNVLAIEVHNTDSGSSDMTLIPFLTLGLRTKPTGSRGFDEILSNAFAGELHTNFKIKQTGEGLFLSNANGQPVDSMAAVTVPAGLSFGREKDGAEQLVYFSRPTPGRSNDNRAVYRGRSEAVHSSHIAGFYDSPVTVSLQTESGTAPIYFTTNGEVPDSSDTIYTQPLSIDSTVVLRMRTIEAGKLPGTVLTQTFLITENFRLPVLSLALEPADLWDEQNGIYVEGPNASPEYPFFGANYWQDWEKPAHLELFELDNRYGGRVIDQDIGLKIFAGYSRVWPQKAFSIHARRKYGKSTISHRIFPARKIDEFKNFVLRNSGSDWALTMIRDAMMQRLIREHTDLDYQETRPAIVFLNGHYWGIYNLREKLNEDYLAAHHGVDSKYVDILEGAGAWVVEGDDRHYRAMLAYLEQNDITQPEVYQQVGTMMEIDNFIDYQIAQIYFANTDWPGNNIKIWRPQIPQGRWRWLLYDTDFGFGLFHNSQVDANMLEFATATDGPIWPNPPRSTWLFRRMLENATFRDHFITRFSGHLNITFVPQRVQKIISEMKSVIEPDMPRNIRRWNNEPAAFNRSFGSFAEWSHRVEELKAFAARRPAYVRQHLRVKFQLPGTFRLQIVLQPERQGDVYVGGLKVPQSDWQGIYFDNIPVEISALAKPGFHFAGWSGADTSSETSISVTSERNIKLIAHFEPGATSVAPVVINELNFLPQTQNSPGDWVELANPTNSDIDVTGWQFQDSDDAHIFSMPRGTKIPANGFLVLCRDTVSFSQVFPEVENFVGNLNFGLKSTGELVRLFDKSGIIVDSLRFTTGSPWPEVAPGFTLELRIPDLDNSLPGNWSAATSPGGTPGAENSATTATTVESSQAEPDGFSLAQNYPNPFNPQTRIEFEIASDEFVKLEIFDLNGRKVATLAEGKLQAGKYKIQWRPAPSLASGVYFYRLRSGAQHFATRRMIFLK